METLIKILRKPLILIGFKFWNSPKGLGFKELLNVLKMYIVLIPILLGFLTLLFSHMNISFLFFHSTITLLVFSFISYPLFLIFIFIDDKKNLKSFTSWIFIFVFVFIMIGIILFVKPFILDRFGFLKEEKAVIIEDNYSSIRSRGSGMLGNIHYVKIKGEDESYEFGYNDPNTQILKENIIGKYKIIVLPNSRIILGAEKLED